MRALAITALLASHAFAQPAAPEAPPPEAPPAQPVPRDPATALREANQAATAGDWSRVSTLIQPLLARQLERTDLAEAHRLAGIAALFAQPANKNLAEHHFVQYLRIDLDAHLDPALYPPEVVNFFNDVRSRHAAELKALRPKKRYFILTFLPPFGQFQNGESTKGFIVGGLLTAFLALNMSSYITLRSWCTTHEGSGGARPTCDDTSDHVDGARTLKVLNIAAGVGAILTYGYGVWDGIRGYRRETRAREMAPYVTTSPTGAVVGVAFTF